ncbi:MAG: hypothetical protein H6732_06930 [Alphaproteobacteria bacterium]|nr:hypothetical protein [Alphaproteobacteria bacterium]
MPRTLALVLACALLPGSALATQCVVDVSGTRYSVVDFRAPPTSGEAPEQVAARATVVVHLVVDEDPLRSSVRTAPPTPATRWMTARVVRAWKWPGGADALPATLEVPGVHATSFLRTLGPGAWLVFTGAPEDGRLPVGRCSPVRRLSVPPGVDPAVEIETIVVGEPALGRLTAALGPAFTPTVDPAPTAPAPPR